MTTPAHYKYIDALRGWAFLGVLTVHAGQLVNSLPGGEFTEAGKYGVQLFFMLSAITLLQSMKVRTSEEKSPTRNFFIRRFFRIAPLFWFGIVLYFLLEKVGLRPPMPEGRGPVDYLLTIFFLHGWMPTSINSVVPGGWSIAVEMTFYLCLPFLAARITFAWAALVCTFAAIVGSIVLNGLASSLLLRLTPPNEHNFLVPQFLLYWFPSQVPVFLLGFVACYALRKEAVMKFLKQPGRAAWLLVMALYGLIALAHTGGDTLLPIYLYFPAVFVVIILSLAARPFLPAVNAVTCGIGTISFSCYITHFAALEIVQKYLTANHFASFPHLLAPWFQFLTIWITALGLTIAASTLTYLLIEKPGTRLGSALIRQSEACRNSPLQADGCSSDVRAG